MESLIDFNILKDSHLFRKMEPLEKGWSNDRKYIIYTSDNKKLLLRISAISKFDENDRQDNLSFLGLELDDKRIDSVIINGATIKNLKRSYPNYFLDAQNFIKNIQARLK